MATTQVCCPKCLSPCLLESEKDLQYACTSCDTVFRFVVKKGNIDPVVIGSLDCLACGSPLKMGLGYTCDECGSKNLCGKCVVEAEGKVICRKCLTKAERSCDLCNRESAYTCGVCGIKRCAKDYNNFNVEIKEYSRVLDLKTGRFYSLYCPTCKSEICDKCFNKKEGFLRGGLSFYCKKCGSKLTLRPPLSYKKSPL